MKQILSAIYTKFSSCDLSKLSSSLACGKLGIALLGEYAHKNNLQSEAVLCNKCAEYVFQHMEEMPVGFMHGTLGGMYTIGRLSGNKDTILPSLSSDLLNKILKQNYKYSLSSPYKTTQSDTIYPFALAVLPFCDQADTSLFRFRWQEQLIMQIVDCETLLTRYEPYVFSPKNLGYAMLHSIYYFLCEAEQRRIYTYKAHELKQIIINWPHKIKDKSIADKYIFEFIINGRSCFDCSNYTFDQQIDLLAEIGLFAFLYRNPQLFCNLYNNISTPLKNIL
ncbi:MAG: hypothetical protein K2L71_01855 [Muribaculaceae bacterium]|nr:hypothetical protein [Muribaculaceae bacterium]